MKWISLILFLSLTVRADIVFIDLNNVKPEIEVVKKELERRAQADSPARLSRTQLDDYVKKHLIVLPGNAAEISNANIEIKKLDEQSKSLSLRFDASCTGPTAGADCPAISKSLLEIQSKKEALKPQEYTAAALKADLAKLAGRNISSVMISAHDGGGNFYGQNMAGLRGEEFLDAFKQMPNRENVKSMYLLGCESAVAQTYGSKWKPAFPQAAFIAGWDNVGFLNTNPQGQKFIKDVLENEQGIMTSKTMTEAERKLYAIAPRDDRHTVSALITLCNQPPMLVSSKTRTAVPLTEQLGCQKSPEKIKQSIIYLKCVQSEGAGCPLSRAAEMSEIDKENCDFDLAPGQGSAQNGDPSYNEALSFRNKYYVLRGLQGAGKAGGDEEAASFKDIYAHAPEELKAKMSVDTGTLAGERAKILELKNYYAQAFDFEKIKTMPVDQLNAMAKDKAYIDRAWQAVADLDIELYQKVPEEGRRDLGGFLRADAFKAAIDNKKTNLTYQQRIQSVEAEYREASAKGTYKNELGADLSAFQQEIKLLKSYATPQ